MAGIFLVAAMIQQDPIGSREPALVMPHAWALEAFEVLAIDDGGVGDVLPFLGILLGHAAGFYVLATWRLRAVLTR